MVAAWGEHGEVSKDFATAKADTKKFVSEHPKETALGGAAAGALGVKYAGGAVALRKLKNAESAGAHLRKIGEAEKHASGANGVKAALNPGEYIKHFKHQYSRVPKVGVSPDLLKRKAGAGAAHWEHFSGMKMHRAVVENKNPLLKLHPRYADHKVLHAAIQNAPKTDRELHRGVAMSKADVDAIKPGQRMGGRAESWSDSKELATAHGSRMSSPVNQKASGQKVGGATKDHTVVFHMEPGAHALNIQGLGKMAQREYIHNGHYEVTRVEHGDDGLFSSNRHHVYVKPVNRQVEINKRDKPLLTPTQLRRRQQTQGHLAAAGATLGLTALGAKGASAALKAGKLTKITNAAQVANHLDKTSVTLTTVGAGVGGASGFNGARLSSDSARRHVQKNAGAVMDFGLGSVQQGDASGARDEIAKNFADSMEEVSKLGSPKVRAQGILTTNNKTHENDDLNQWDVHSKGKSMILRRPKYQLVGMNSDAAKSPKTHTFAGLTPNGRASKKLANRTHEFYTSGKKQGPAFPGTKGSDTFVRKAYDPERNRMKRMDRYSNGATAASGALGLAAGHTAFHAVGRPGKTVSQSVTPKKAGDPTVKVTHIKGKGLFAPSGAEVRGSLKKVGVAAGLGAAAVGADMAAHRIRSYKKGSGARYSALRMQSD